ncbi:MAG: allophanate hydrolase subunit 1 [Nocardioides sp.]
MQVLPAGPSALLAEPDDPRDVPVLYADLRRDLACRDLVPGARTVLLDGPADLDASRTYLAAWRSSAHAGRAPAHEVEVPTTYDGEDLDDVARRWGMTRAEAVATHIATEFTVAFVGFSPGFAYCTGLPPELAVSRLDRPRPRVPAGSVGLAGEYAGVYPSASPGGWRLLGRTDLTLWDASREQPALLTPGTRVRFREV